MEFNPALHKVLLEYETQMYTNKEGLNFNVFIPFGNLEDFTETLSITDFDEGGIEAALVHGSVCINLRDLFEINGYKLNHYKHCFSEDDFYRYRNEILEFDNEKY